MKLRFLLSALIFSIEAQTSPHRHGSQRLHKLHRRLQSQNNTMGLQVPEPDGPSTTMPTNDRASTVSSSQDNSRTGVQAGNVVTVSTTVIVDPSGVTFSPSRTATASETPTVFGPPNESDSVSDDARSSSPLPDQSSTNKIAAATMVPSPTTNQFDTADPGTSTSFQGSSEDTTSGSTSTTNNWTDANTAKASPPLDDTSQVTSPYLTSTRDYQTTISRSAGVLTSTPGAVSSFSRVATDPVLPLTSPPTPTGVIASSRQPDDLSISPSPVQTASGTSATEATTERSNSGTSSVGDPDPSPTISRNHPAVHTPTGTSSERNTSSDTSVDHSPFSGVSEIPTATIQTPQGPSTSPTVDSTSSPVTENNTTAPTSASFSSHAGLSTTDIDKPTITSTEPASLSTNTSISGLSGASGTSTSSDGLSSASSTATSVVTLPVPATISSGTSTQTSTSTDISATPTLVLPSVMLTQSSTSTSQTSDDANSAVSTSSATTASPASTGIAWPAAIAPAGGIRMPNSTQTLVQIGFDQVLNFPFVVSNALSTAQILQFLPEAVSSALGISSASVFSNSLRSYPKTGYLATVAYLVIPNTETIRLEGLWNNTSSALYKQSDSGAQTLVVLIDTTIPLFLPSTTSVTPGTSNTASTSSVPPRPNAAGYGGLADINSASAAKHNVPKVAGISFGAAAAAGAYGGLMFLVARRRRRRRRQAPRRFSRAAPSVAGSVSAITTRHGGIPISGPMNPENSLGI